MALYKRGKYWWYEIRTATMRERASTGCEDKKSAQAIYSAALLTHRNQMDAAAAEKVVRQTLQLRTGMPLADIWPTYEGWVRAKGVQLARKTLNDRRNRIANLVAWLKNHRITTMDGVTVDVARRYVAEMMADDANKTQRLKCMDISTIWKAVAAEKGSEKPNPWPAACPALDGSAKRRDVFSAEQIAAILAAAKTIGHDWYGVCLTARWIGQRYGDCATLEWGTVEWASKQDVLKRGVVDLDAGIIVIDPQKTRRHNTRLYIPISDELAAYLRTIRKDSGTLFYAHDVQYRRRKPMDPDFKSVLAAAGITGGYFDFHSWRHTFRSQLGEASVSDETANRFGGWTAPKMGAHYDHSAHLAEMREALARIQ